MHNRFRESGYKIFGLHGINQDGSCACGNPECTAAGKHPISSGWQHTPEWSDDQFETMHEMGQFDSGYGVLVSHGLLVVDVDARNGGVESYAKLIEEIPEISGAGLMVETGSGGGSKHLYFSMPRQSPLLQHLEDYPGIDFKSSGYVVGPDSLHASGKKYTAVLGGPEDISMVPEKLIDLLKKPDRHRCVNSDGNHIDVSEKDISGMLDHIDPDSGHEIWIRCGMAIHAATGGTSLNLWDEWSAKGSKYPGFDNLEKRWHSFGKSSNPVTIGTLMHYAQQNGWKQPVEFDSDTSFFDDVEPIDDVNDIDISGIDLLRPPGFTGEVCEWINSICLYPRENLAVAASLMAISNCAGMRYIDPLDNANFNLFCFGVADSSSGKETIINAHNELISAAGLSPALVGAIKSEQEIYRNLIRHQAAFYSIDELGEHLCKINNARKKGTSSYLEGVIGTLLSVYSKANSFVPVSGDLKEQMKSDLISQAKRLQKAIDNNEDENGAMEFRLQSVMRSLKTVDDGIENPFLSIFGVTTPERFNELMDYDMCANGFMGRSIIFREMESNPKVKPRHKRKKDKSLPENIVNTLRNLYAPGRFDFFEGQRIEREGEKIPLETTDEAERMLDLVSEKFHDESENQLEATGMHPITRRGYELVSKVSGILGIPGGIRTAEHVLWAYALISRDLSGKIGVVKGNDSLEYKILSLISKEHGETMYVIKRKCRKYSTHDVEKSVSRLIKSGKVKRVKEMKQGRGRKQERYYEA